MQTSETGGTRAFVIAEAGVNHDGSLELAHRLVAEAHRAGADAVKFQTFRAEKLVSRFARKAAYQERTTGSDEGQHAMLKRLELDERAFGELAEASARLGIEFLSSPFDAESLRMLVDLGVRRVKLGSGELTNEPLLREAARTGLPLVLSTGMATLGDIEDALSVVAHETLGGRTSRVEAFCSAEGQRVLEERVTLLHCTTEYPAPVEETNLRALQTLRDAFGVRVGYSDHTQGIAVTLASVALGACVVEKHFTLDRTRPGPDHAASLEPNELAELVRGVRVVEAALGRSMKRPTRSERANITAARRSVVAATKIPAGATITREMLAVKRPATGVSPMRLDELVGKIAARSYAEDEPLDP